MRTYRNQATYQPVEEEEEMVLNIASTHKSHFATIKPVEVNDFVEYMRNRIQNEKKRIKKASQTKQIEKLIREGME
jgi:DNA polymerase II small subunit/DNA polymerase delta subunit B